MSEWTRETKWRQGYLLGTDAIEALQLHIPRSIEQQLAIVASHDCDLAQHPDGEPLVEVIIGRLVDDKDGNCTHAKNSRKLHIELTGSTSFWAEFDATAKRTIDKRALNGFAPNAQACLSVENQAVFQIWLASRYRRSAFPDEFERRLTSKELKLHEKIAKAVKPHGQLITGVFFDVDDGKEVTRVGPDDTYTLDITILHSSDPDFTAAENAAEAAAQVIEKAFKEKLLFPTAKWQQIELRSCDPVSESVLTYQNFKQLKRWRLEHLSLASEPQQSVLAE